MAITPGNAMNIANRAVDHIVDKEAADTRERVYAYFELICAYCGEYVEEGRRRLDHAKGKGNHLGNRVFACEKCNDREKREMPWHEFLALKVQDEVLRAERAEKIERWIELNPHEPVIHSDAVRAKEAETRRLIVQFGEACTELRELITAERRP